MSEGYNEGREAPKEGGGAAPQPYTSAEGLRGSASPRELREAAANANPEALNDPRAEFVGADGQARSYDDDRRYRTQNPQPVLVLKPEIPHELRNAARDGKNKNSDKPTLIESIGSAIFDRLEDKDRKNDLEKAKEKIEKSTGKPAQLTLSHNGNVNIEPSKGRRLTYNEFYTAVQLAKKWGKRLSKPWNVNTEAELPSSGIKDYDLKYNPQTGNYDEYKN